MGTHPRASYLEQHIIDTEHYHRLREELRWVAQRNNSWSLHARRRSGADRAVAVCDWMRELLPPLLALSANSPSSTTATRACTASAPRSSRVFPRCGVHEPFGDWGTYAGFVDTLARTRSIVEATQLWWSVRPHHLFGTRRCGSATRRPAATSP